MSYFHGIAIDVKKESGSHTDSLADADISNDAAYAAVWQFRLKGQGADVFKIKTDDGFYIFEGDEIAGYAPASHDSKEKECLKKYLKRRRYLKALIVCPSPFCRPGDAEWAIL